MLLVKFGIIAELDFRKLVVNIGLGALVDGHAHCAGERLSVGNLL